MSATGRTSTVSGRPVPAERTAPPHSPLLSVAGVALVLGAVVLVVAQQLAPSTPAAAPADELAAALSDPGRSRAALALAMVAQALLAGGALAVPFLTSGRRHAEVVVGALVWAVGGAVSLAATAAQLTAALVVGAAASTGGSGEPGAVADAVGVARQGDLLRALDLAGPGLAVLGLAVTMVALVLARVVRPWVLIPVVVGALVLAAPDHGWLDLIGTLVSLVPVVVLGLLLVRSRPLEPAPSTAH